MPAEQMEQRLENVERRVDRIERILPTLATRDDLRAAIAPLATKAELQAVEQRMRSHVAEAVGSSEQRMRSHVAEAVSASEQRMRSHVAEAVSASEQRIRAHVAESEQRTRTHFDVVAESLRDDIRLVAEAVAVLTERAR